MLQNSWENSKSHYNSNYVAAYDYIMNKTVPSICIVSSVVGIITCLLLWKVIYDEMHKSDSKIPSNITNVLIAFTFTNTIGQIGTIISSIVFLYYYGKLKEVTSSYNNMGARILGVLFIWIRLANTCLIFIMLLKSITKKVFALWNQMIILCVFLPLPISVYAGFEDITGFQFSQLPLGSCSLVMVPKLETFKESLIWAFTLEILDVSLFVFNCIRIIQLQLKYSKKRDIQYLFLLQNRQLIPDIKSLLIYVASVMMVSKSLEVIRIISVALFFLEMIEKIALRVGMFNYSLLIMQALFECAQPVLTYMVLKIYLRSEDRFLYFIRSRGRSEDHSEIVENF